MNVLEAKLFKAVKEVLEENLIDSAGKELIQIQATRKDFEGDLTIVVFPLLRITKKSPEQTAQMIGEWLNEKAHWIQNFNVVKGFLNITVEKSFWINFLEEVKGDATFGLAKKASGRKVMVEYSSPNTNKPLHLGHLRNNFLGYSVAEILKANGHQLLKVQIINDRGIHICKSMLAWKLYGNGETPASSGMKGDHLVGKYYVKFDQVYKEEIAELIDSGKTEEEAKKSAPILLEAQKMLQDWEAGEQSVRALWKEMNTWVYDGFKTTYETMGVDFDKLYYESETFELGKEQVLKNLDKPDFFQKEDGSIWVDLSSHNLDNKLLLRGDGTSVYMTQDVGTAIIRHQEFNCNEYHYVVGNEQDHHFKVLSIVLQKMGYSWASELKHLSYGMVDLPSGKMKSREGTVVDADDLMAEMKATAKSISETIGKLDGLSDNELDHLYNQIGMGALKYYILKVDPKKRMQFNPEESVDFNGNTGPFIQYANARIQSILRKNKLESDVDLPQAESLLELDFDLIKKLFEFPQTVEDAGKDLSPAHIANYAFELVKVFNHYYQNAPSIANEKDNSIKKFRLDLCATCAHVLQTSMRLLGIETPSQM